MENFCETDRTKTNSYQLNKIYYWERGACDTKPQLEIGADDVKCTHGATIGQLNEDEILLQSRCIASKAVKMLSEVLWVTSSHHSPWICPVKTQYACADNGSLLNYGHDRVCLSDS